MCGIKYKDRKCCLEHTNVKYNLMGDKCLCCKRNYQKTFNENYRKKFTNTYKFAYHNIDEFFVAGRKCLIGKNLIKHRHQKNKIIKRTQKKL